jgi:serine phosphatase RsbU (regulator of sigma subunit)
MGGSSCGLGYEGAAKAFREAASAATAREVVEALGAALAQLRAGRPLEDDVTFVVVRVEAPPFR